MPTPEAENAAGADAFVLVPDKTEEAAVATKALQPQREATFKDYLVSSGMFSAGLHILTAKRVFTYAKKWDIALMVMAALAAVSAGVVSVKLLSFHELSQFRPCHS
jgi:hypothetical protein